MLDDGVLLGVLEPVAMAGGEAETSTNTTRL
jgi:hypothetical protein